MSLIFLSLIILNPQGIVDGIRSGRTVLKLFGPSDPMVLLRKSDCEREL